MTEARLESQWQQTSLVASMIANVLCTKKSQLTRPAQFNPFAKPAKHTNGRTSHLPTITATEVGEFLKSRSEKARAAGRN